MMKKKLNCSKKCSKTSANATTPPKLKKRYKNSRAMVWTSFPIQKKTATRISIWTKKNLIRSKLWSIRGTLRVKSACKRRKRRE